MTLQPETKLSKIHRSGPGPASGFKHRTTVCVIVKERINRVRYVFGQLGIHGVVRLQGLWQNLTGSDYKTLKDLHNARKLSSVPIRMGSIKEIRLLAVGGRCQFKEKKKRKKLFNHPNNRPN